MPRVPVNQPYSTAQSIPFGAPDTAARFGKHAGIDYGIPIGRTVYASAPGRITAYTYGLYQGKVVEVYTGKEYYHCFHNSKLLVSPGQTVKQGQPIALSGAEGQGVTGPHVHFGVAKKSIPSITSFNDFIDPNKWLKGGIDMITNYGLNILFRLYLGRPPSASEVTNYVGKYTVDQVGVKLRNSDPYQTRLRNAKAGKLNPVNHLPTALREAYVTPQVVTLKPGVYKVI